MTTIIGVWNHIFGFGTPIPKNRGIREEEE